jgi:N-carbamoylputrescine amidase
MASLAVALLQLRSPGPEPGRALREGERACREARRLGADVALFPEMWQVGYAHCPGDDDGRRAWSVLATEADGDFVGRFRRLARELGIAIVITYLQRWEGAPRNAASVIDRHGDVVLTYAKVHTCDFAMEWALTPGDGFRVTDLDVACGRVRVGVMICYDREFPESARALMLGGAEVILTPNACPLTDDRIGQFRARAFENMVGVAMANYAAPDPAARDPGACNGRSAAFSGICFAADGTPLDHRLVEAGRDEGIHLVTFDLDELRAYRRHETLGDAYRKPGAYGALVADGPAPVFARRDSRRRRAPRPSG